MKYDIERRLHRVTIKIDKGVIKCPYSVDCVGAEKGYRCNQFYEKCSRFVDFKANSHLL